MRAMKELKDGDYVNLGLGLPTLCALYMPEGVIFQCENGALGYGPLLLKDEVEKAEWHYHDADGRCCAQAPGMAVFYVAISFAMIRRGRLISVMGDLTCRREETWRTGHRRNPVLRARPEVYALTGDNHGAEGFPEILHPYDRF